MGIALKSDSHGATPGEFKLPLTVARSSPGEVKESTDIDAVNSETVMQKFYPTKAERKLLLEALCEEGLFISVYISFCF